MVKKLTDQQQRVLSFVTETVQDRGYPPSVREVCEYLHVSSSSTAHAHLQALQRKGYLRINPKQPRAISVVSW